MTSPCSDAVACRPKGATKWRPHCCDVPKENRLEAGPARNTSYSACFAATHCAKSSLPQRERSLLRFLCGSTCVHPAAGDIRRIGKLRGVASRDPARWPLRLIRSSTRHTATAVTIDPRPPAKYPPSLRIKERGGHRIAMPTTKASQYDLLRSKTHGPMESES